MNAEKGVQLAAQVLSVKGNCNAGHCAGDTLLVSARNTGGMCGYLYYSAFPYILMLQFGGAFPWDKGPVVELQCPDRENLVTIRLTPAIRVP